MSPSEITLLAAVALFLVAAVVSRRRARSRVGNRHQQHWDARRASFRAAFPGSIEVDGEWLLAGRDQLETAVQISYAHPDGRQCVLQFVAGAEHGGTDLLGVHLPDRSFPLVIQITDGSCDEVQFKVPGRADEDAAMQLVAELDELGVHNLSRAPHMNVSVTGSEQFGERLPRILDVLVRIEALQPRA